MRHCNETFGWHACAGRGTHVVDLDPTVARTEPHDGGAGSAADPPGAPETEKHPPEEITTKLNSVSRRCVETLRGQERPVVCEIPVVDSDIEASRERVRRHASGSAVSATAAEADARPGEEPRQKAFTGGRVPLMKGIVRSA